MRFTVWITLSLLLALRAVAADPPGVERGPSTTHNSACDLAESMAGKLGFKDKLAPDNAQRTCSMLAPTMNDADRAEFLRCCIKRLAGTNAAPAKQPAAKTKPNGI